MKKIIKNLLCRFLCYLFWHPYIKTDYAEWEKTGTNFVCTRCGKKIKHFPFLYRATAKKLSEDIIEAGKRVKNYKK